MTAARVSLLAVLAACGPREPPVPPEAPAEHAACVSALRAFATLDAQRFEPLPPRCTLADADAAFGKHRNRSGAPRDPELPRLGDPVFYRYRAPFRCDVWIAHGRIGAVDHRTDVDESERVANLGALGNPEDRPPAWDLARGGGTWFTRGFALDDRLVRTFVPTTRSDYYHRVDRLFVHVERNDDEDDTER